MKASCRIVLAGFLLAVASGSSASAEWVWVEDSGVRPEVRVEIQQPRGPGYYQQERVVVQTQPVVTSREVFRDGSCEVTRSYWSDGASTDDRVCTRLLLPHEFLIDRVGRQFDRMRGYERRVTVYEDYED